MGHLLKLALFAILMTWGAVAIGVDVVTGRLLVLGLCVLAIALAVWDYWKLGRWPVAYRWEHDHVDTHMAKRVEIRQALWRRTWLIKRVNEGERIPRLYGVAWHSGNSPSVIVAPVPFNMVLGVAYDLWAFMAYGWRYSAPQSSSVAYHQGRRDGRDEAFNELGQKKIRF